MKSAILVFGLFSASMSAQGADLPRYRMIDLGIYNVQWLSEMSDDGEIPVFGGYNEYLYSPDSGLKIVPGWGTVSHIRRDGQVLLSKELGTWSHEVYSWDRVGSFQRYDWPSQATTAYAHSWNLAGTVVGGSTRGVKWQGPHSYIQYQNTYGLFGINEAGYFCGDSGAGSLIFSPDSMSGTAARVGGHALDLYGIADNGWAVGRLHQSTINQFTYVVDVNSSFLFEIRSGGAQAVSLRAARKNGWLVGNTIMETSNRLTARGAIWSPQTGVLDINNLIEGSNHGAVLDGVISMGANGCIAATDNRDPMNRRSYYLVPVPEPYTIAVLAPGIVAFLRKRRRRA